MERCPDGHSACKFSAQSMNIVAKICGHDSSKRGNEKAFTVTKIYDIRG